jgi:hypothetical protein
MERDSALLLGGGGGEDRGVVEVNVTVVTSDTAKPPCAAVAAAADLAGVKTRLRAQKRVFFCISMVLLSMLFCAIVIWREVALMQETSFGVSQLAIREVCPVTNDAVSLSRA